MEDTFQTTEISLEVKLQISKKIFIKDNTLWGRLNRSKTLDVPDSIIQQIYMENFTKKIDDTSTYIRVVVFHNERYFPFRGWNCLHLHFNERAKLSDPYGVKYPGGRYLKQVGSCII